MKKLLSPRRHVGVLLAVFLICSLAAGCGKPKGIVSGRISYQGKALPAGFVTFVPEKGPAISAPIDNEGRYKVENVPVGTARIGVRAQTGQDTESQNQPPPKPRSPADMKEYLKPKGPRFYIPPQYNEPEKSGLTCEVKQGPQEHNIELK